MQAPTKQPQNKPVRRSGQISLALSIFLIGFFSLVNAGVTNRMVFVPAIGVELSGVYASTLLKDRADSLDLKSAVPSSAILRFAISLPFLLLVAFAGLLALQFW
jgi:hypothetical protein